MEEGAAVALTEIVARVREGQARLAALLGGLADAEARADSALPGWSRGHVITHIAHHARAFARQAEYARQGRTIEVYDGGRPARDAAIEAGAGRPAAELRADVIEAGQRLESAWEQVRDWNSPVTFRDGVLGDTVYGRWREVEIHTADLDLGYGPSDWSADFCAHALDFLAPRAPSGVELTLAPDDSDRRWTWGNGSPVQVQGALTDLTAWMAGRTPVGPVAASTGALPVLGAWP